MHVYRILVAAIFVLAPCTLSCSRDRSLKRAAAQIRPEAVRAHMAFLADDLLEGRLPGTRGYDLAARYVASQFDSLGLEPAGNESWFQPVPLERMDSPRGEITLTRNGHREQFIEGRDFVINAYPPASQATVEGPAVFGGYCVSAPELGYDDYAATKIDNTIVVCLEGAPARLPAAVEAHYSGLVKMQEAAKRGAKGIVTLHAGQAERDYPFEVLVPLSKMPDFRWIDSKGQPADSFPELRGNAVLDENASKRLFESAPRSFSQVLTDAQASKPQSFPLGIQLKISSTSTRSTVKSANVIGAIRGSDPKLRDEYVVYTAHLDHLGIGPPVNGDAIYNGAMDNAAGVAALIETARAFRSLARPPRRSVLLVATTAEDAGSIGLLGSDYFVHNPTVQRSHLAANINIDGLPIFFDFRDVVAYGAEHSSLDSPVRRAASMLDLEVIGDPWPEQGMFVRGDQYSFVRQGIPAVWVSMGFKAADPRKDAKKIRQDYMTHRYHQPRDDMNQHMDFKAAAQGVRVEFLVGALVADDTQRPTWKFGDFFAKAFRPVQ